MTDTEERKYAPPTRRGAILLDQIQDPVVKQGLSYWRSLCGSRSYPARAQISPREIAGILRNVVILKVLDSGADYEFRIVGDAHVQSHGHNLQGQRLTALEHDEPRYGAALRRLYDQIVETQTPLALQGWFAREGSQTDIYYTESVFLPLGQDDRHVDYILVFSGYTPKAN